MPLQDIAHRALRRTINILLEFAVDLRRSPQRPPGLPFQNRSLQGRRKRIGMMVWRPRSIHQPTSRFPFIPPHPLVNRLPAHPTSPRQLRQRVITTQIFGNHDRSFVRHTGLFPWHTPSVTYVLGTFCHPSAWNIPGQNPLHGGEGQGEGGQPFSDQYGRANRARMQPSSHPDNPAGRADSSRHSPKGRRRMIPSKLVR